LKKEKFVIYRDGFRIEIPKKRSVEKDYKFYDPPIIVWRKINRQEWPYRQNRELYVLRDKALMSLLYLSCSRVSEIVRADVKVGFLPSVRKNQFVKIGEFLMLRNVPIVKRKFVKKGEDWIPVENIQDYPYRQEIDMPLKGGLSIFTKLIVRYLDFLDEEEELFKFKTKRAHQIVKYCSGEFPHYFREMGLKLRLRLFDKHLVQLKTFSGHQRLTNLTRYLEEAEMEESRKRMLSITLEE